MLARLPSRIHPFLDGAKMLPAAGLSDACSVQHFSLSGCGALSRHLLCGTLPANSKNVAGKGAAFHRPDGKAAEPLPSRAGNRCNGGARWKMGDPDGTGCSRILGVFPTEKLRPLKKSVSHRLQDVGRVSDRQMHRNQLCSHSHTAAEACESRRRDCGTRRPQATPTLPDTLKVLESECVNGASQSREAGGQLDLREREQSPAGVEVRQTVPRFISLCAAILVASTSISPAQAIAEPSHALQDIESFFTHSGALSDPHLRTEGDELTSKTGSARSLYPFTAPPVGHDKSALAHQTPGHHLDPHTRLVQKASVKVRPSWHSQGGSLKPGQVSNLETSIGDTAESKDGDQKVVGNPVEKSLPAASPDLNPEVNANLVLEAWSVVDQVYLDARGKGFDRDAWAVCLPVQFIQTLLICSMFAFPMHSWPLLCTNLCISF